MRHRASVTSWLAAFAVLASIAGCGGPDAPRGIGTSHRPRDPQALELSLRTSDGRVLELADQRGSPVMIFLFATYDGASLATHRELTRFTRAALDTVVVAVALQPDAPTFAAAFAETQLPPYTVAYDHGETIVRGASDLGHLEAIPTVVMIDAHGRECARHVGYASERVLRAMHEVALSRGGITSGEEQAAPATTPAPEGPASLPVHRSERSDTQIRLETELAADPDAMIIEPDDAEE